MQIIKHGITKEIEFDCPFCNCKWKANVKESVHYVAVNNGITFDMYTMKCPECSRETTTTHERNGP